MTPSIALCVVAVSLCWPARCDEGPRASPGSGPWAATRTQGSATAARARGRELHVDPRGDDAGTGDADAPLRTISAAAQRAMPGDVITVHAGVYRERVDPPRGGTADDRRIVYRAAPGEEVVVTGSEVVSGWRRVAHDTWTVDVPNARFGDFNPFADRIGGDWFDGRGRAHHTGAVYRGGHWLIEAARQADVLLPIDDVAPGYAPDAGGGSGYLLNIAAHIALLSGVAERGRVRVDAPSAMRGVQLAACSLGGECVGFIEHGDRVRYDGVDFGTGVDRLVFQAASATSGGRIEVRIDAEDGPLIGRCDVPSTGGWQSWQTFDAAIEPQTGVHDLCLVFRAPAATSEPGFGLWFAEVGDETTTLWAQLRDFDPDAEDIEINVRQSVFYPSRPGIDFLTVRGFTLEHAATPWAPPTAQQIGLLGTHWSRGWIIESNTVRYSTCSGISLGKYGDEFDNTSRNSAEGYVETIHRALQRGWAKGEIGGHVVRDNQISHCEQAGIVGSLGAAFSTVTGNDVHHIHVRRLFGGAEMAGIKLHGAVDVLLADNHVHHCCRGIWLDWMAQGARVTGNLLHDNAPWSDLFLEVNHGPLLVDHNVCLSANAIRNWSHGTAYAHNLIAGRVTIAHGERRETPFLEAHSTAIAGLAPNPSGDDRLYGNLFVGTDMSVYDDAKLPVAMAGNVYLAGARPPEREPDAVVRPDLDPGLRLVESGAGLDLQLALDVGRLDRSGPLVTTELLGLAAVPGLPFVGPDGEPYRLDTDLARRARDATAPFPGPFRRARIGASPIAVWPPGRRD
ncbi:MAG: carbohydrate-binding protein [Planctomycetes bacterium]|nr:carbohydrate-binding protein [Planctomycetota bacterium]